MPCLLQHRINAITDCATGRGDECSSGILFFLDQIVWTGRTGICKKDQRKENLKQSRARSLNLIKSALNILAAARLLQLAPPTVTPRVTGGLGFVTSVISCYQIPTAGFQPVAEVMDWGGGSRRAQTRVSTIARHISPAPCSASNPFLIMTQATEDGGIQIKADVRDALERGLPVVALESTIISHGMPYPLNFETAKEVEAIVRESGAVPATIAIMDGVPCIGLEESELQKLAQLGKSAKKTARRDIAHVAGISVFVTGGIGGVHREGESTMDVSSDLTELGRTAVTVVCAGVKSILDIPRTLEYLETQGVTVIAYGTDEFPAFFTPRSGCKAPSRLDTPEECAAVTAANLSVGLQSGILVAVPVPAHLAAAAEPVEAAIQTSLKELKENNITGAAITPYVLHRVNELTGGASLASNIALIRNKARVGSQIAIATARLVEEGS